RRCVLSGSLGGRFLLEREIGSGGMASVYLGADEVLGRRVAVKVLKPEFQDSDIGARFRREGRTAAKLSHPNIVQVYDAGEDELDGHEVSYIVMEHVSGGDLRQRISGRGGLSTGEISTLAGIAAGLAHAHERGIVHRDVKPHNILMDGKGQPKLTDFGIARALDAAQFTQTGMYLGTARYSSPEQLQGKETTAKSDVYSLGATLYEAVTGATPFSGTPIEIASQHVSKPPVPPGKLAPVDQDLETLILECLAKSPEDRPTAAIAESRLSSLSQSTGGAQQPAVAAVGLGETGKTAKASDSATAVPAAGSAGTGSRGSGTPRWAPVAGALAVLALLGVLGGYALLGGEDRPAQTPAPQTTEQDVAGAGDTGQVPGAASGSTTDRAVTRREPAEASGSQQQSDPEKAAQATRDVYQLAADGDYGESYDLLSQNFKQNQAATQSAWSGQFDTLEQIDFLQGPNVQVSGDTAQVTGVTRAIHSDRTERNTATWSLVREGEGWKLDGIISIDTERVG
ncbi:MAG: protein kinase, partial [Rubrobacteraceae bacterium]